MCGCRRQCQFSMHIHRRLDIFFQNRRSSFIIQKWLKSVVPKKPSKMIQNEIFKQRHIEKKQTSFRTTTQNHRSKALEEWPKNLEEAQCTAEERVTLRRLSGQPLQIQVKPGEAVARVVARAQKILQATGRELHWCCHHGHHDHGICMYLWWSLFFGSVFCFRCFDHDARVVEAAGAGDSDPRRQVAEPRCSSCQLGRPRSGLGGDAARATSRDWLWGWVHQVLGPGSSERPIGFTGQSSGASNPKDPKGLNALLKNIRSNNVRNWWMFHSFVYRKTIHVLPFAASLRLVKPWETHRLLRLRKASAALDP